MKQNFLSRLISAWVLVSFLAMSIVPPQARAQVAGLPVPGIMVTLSEAYTPVISRGLKVHPENPLLFDFIMDAGDTGLAVEGESFKAESEKLIKYFLASLTVKADDQWVNLSPYEKDRIIPEDLGKTELGRDMLAQDYILKQLTASLVYPEKGLGKEFWAKIYERALAQFGTIDIPVDTFNKVWITADKAKVLERNNTAYVIDAHLKVMLESDYMAAAYVSPSLPHRDEAMPRLNAPTAPAQELAKQVMREVIIPQIEQEVNQGKNFTQLRQIFYAMILSTWYKRALKNALLNQVYANKSKINGVASDDLAIKEKIYAQYLAAYRKGVFNYIKEESQASGETIPRKYFSGGLKENLNVENAMVVDYAGKSVPEPVGREGVVRASMSRFDSANVISDRVGKKDAAGTPGKGLLSPQEIQERVNLLIERGHTLDQLQKTLYAVIRTLAVPVGITVSGEQDRLAIRVLRSGNNQQGKMSFIFATLFRIDNVDLMVDSQNNLLLIEKNPSFFNKNNFGNTVQSFRDLCSQYLKHITLRNSQNIDFKKVNGLDVRLRTFKNLVNELDRFPRILQSSDFSLQQIDPRLIELLNQYFIYQNSELYSARQIFLSLKEYGIKEMDWVPLELLPEYKDVYINAIINRFWATRNRLDLNLSAMVTLTPEMSVEEATIVVADVLLDVEDSSRIKKLPADIRMFLGQSQLSLPDKKKFLNNIYYFSRDVRKIFREEAKPGQKIAVGEFISALTEDKLTGVNLDRFESDPQNESFQLQWMKIRDNVLFQTDSSEQVKPLISTKTVNGGIDINSNNMTLDVAREGAGVEMKLDPAMVARFEQGDFSGVVPVILKVTPISSPLPLLGMNVVDAITSHS